MLGSWATTPGVRAARPPGGSTRVPTASGPPARPPAPVNAEVDSIRPQAFNWPPRPRPIVPVAGLTGPSVGRISAPAGPQSRSSA